MDEFLRHYGLIAVFLGMWLEGETVLVIAGFLAHQHLFPLWAAFLVTLLGALSVDHAAYLAGRLSRRVTAIRRFLHPEEGETDSWQSRVGDSWLLFFGIRFVYGTRTPFLFVLGSRRMTWPRFLQRELPAVALWCSVWLFFGHLLSNVVFVLLGSMREHHRAVIVAAVAAVGLAVVAFLAFRRHRRLSRQHARMASTRGPNGPEP